MFQGDDGYDGVCSMMVGRRTCNMEKDQYEKTAHRVSQSVMEGSGSYLCSQRTRSR